MSSAFYQHIQEVFKCSVSYDHEFLPYNVPFPKDAPSLPRISKKARQAIQQAADESEDYRVSSVETATYEEYEAVRDRSVNPRFRRVITFGGIIMQDAEDIRTAKISLASVPAISMPEVLSEAETLFAFAYGIMGYDGGRKKLMERQKLECGQKLNAVINESGLPDKCAWPVMVGAGVDLDIGTLSAGLFKMGLLSEFNEFPNQDPKERARCNYLDSSMYGGRRIDVLNYGRVVLRDKHLNMDEFAVYLGLPGKYIPVANSNVEDLFSKNMMREIIEYCVVDSLNHHFINLCLMYREKVIDELRFKQLWQLSLDCLNRHLDECSVKNRGVEWFLKELPDVKEFLCTPLKLRDEA